MRALAGVVMLLGVIISVDVDAELPTWKNGMIIDAKTMNAHNDSIVSAIDDSVSAVKIVLAESISDSLGANTRDWITVSAVSDTASDLRSDVVLYLLSYLMRVDLTDTLNANARDWVSGIRLADSTGAVRAYMAMVLLDYLTKHALTDTLDTNARGWQTDAQVRAILSDTTASVKDELRGNVSDSLDANSRGWAAQSALADSAGDIRDDFPSLAGYATSAAVGDTATVLRSEFPSLSGLATETALADTAGAIRGAIPDVSGLMEAAAFPDSVAGYVSGLAMETALADSTAALREDLAPKQAVIDTAAAIRGAIPDVSGLASYAAVSDTADQVRSEFPDISNLATPDTTAQIRSEIPDVSGLMEAAAFDDSAATLATKQALADTSAVLRVLVSSAGIGSEELSDSLDVVRGEIPTITPFAETLLDDAAAINARSTLGLGTIATQHANNVNIDGGEIDGAYIGYSFAPRLYQITLYGISGVPANTGRGIIDNFVAGEDIALGDLIYKNANGKWYKAQADSADTAVPGMVALQAKSAGFGGDGLRFGHVLITGWTTVQSTGDAVYVSADVPGQPTTTMPGDPGDYVVPIGTCEGTDLLFFNPMPKGAYVLR